jgi:DNA-binding NarL/FixJ family response regulator
MPITFPQHTTRTMSTIVLADDHALMRAGLRRILEESGHTVLGEAGDGLQVVDVVKQHRPQILMLDLGLPSLHGLDVLRQMRRRAPKVRVLVVSAFNRDEFVVTALRAGAAGYLLKSAAPDQLLQAVEVVATGGYYVSPQLAASAEQYADGTRKDAYDKLTSRQREVFHLMAEGLSYPQIASRLFISARTAEDHRYNISQKLGLETQTDVVLFALRRGILVVDDVGGAPRLDV